MFLAVPEARVENGKAVAGKIALVDYQLLQFESRLSISHDIRSTDQVNGAMVSDGFQTFLQALCRAVFQDHNIASAAAIFEEAPYRISQPAVLRWAADNVTGEMRPQTQHARNGLRFLRIKVRARYASQKSGYTGEELRAPRKLENAFQIYVRSTIAEKRLLVLHRCTLAHVILGMASTQSHVYFAAGPAHCWMRKIDSAGLTMATPISVITCPRSRISGWISFFIALT
jgi:hypothetical protein